MREYLYPYEGDKTVQESESICKQRDDSIYLVAVAAVVHGGQPVVDGSRSVLVEGLAGRLCLEVTISQRLHHGLSHFPLNLNERTHK